MPQSSRILVLLFHFRVHFNLLVSLSLCEIVLVSLWKLTANRFRVRLTQIREVTQTSCIINEVSFRKMGFLHNDEWKQNRTEPNHRLDKTFVSPQPLQSNKINVKLQQMRIHTLHNHNINRIYLVFEFNRFVFVSDENKRITSCVKLLPFSRTTPACWCMCVGFGISENWVNYTNQLTSRYGSARVRELPAGNKNNTWAWKLSCCVMKWQLSTFCTKAVCSFSGRPIHNLTAQTRNDAKKDTEQHNEHPNDNNAIPHKFNMNNVPALCTAYMHNGLLSVTPSSNYIVHLRLE